MAYKAQVPSRDVSASLDSPINNMGFTRGCRRAAAPRISIACDLCLLDRAVSPVPRAESLPAAVPAVGPGSLSESFELGRPFESLERIVSLGWRCCLRASPH